VAAPDTEGRPGQHEGPIRARVTFLGTGTSSGVPVIGCDCAVCRSTDPRDNRLRPSIFVDIPGRAGILVDTGSDLRQQALRHDIRRVDAVLVTHCHADHVMGLDEIRRYNQLQGGPIPFYATYDAWVTLKKTFFYVFDGVQRLGGGIPKIEEHLIEGPFEIGGVRIVPVPLWHGRLPVLGFRFGNFAYLTDCNTIPEASWPLIEGVEVLVLDALREKKHSTHFTLDEALAVVARLRPRRAYFTHMAHDLPHAATNARLPPGVELAYDGLVLDVDAAPA
jgi:phosphoribosyl 1,2-cyclic phosphate phosphodiesterase